MRILSLCTGYGGLDLAVEAVTGARTVAVADIDKGASKILAHRFPHAPNLGDLKRIDWAAWAGVEVMTAGYPCQPFSHAGKREGTDDPRHIFPDIARGIREVGPRLVVLENVRGHLALGFDTVLGALANIGYDARWVCVRASDVGAPHKRERMFIAATPWDANGQRLEGRRSFERAHERSAGPAGLAAADSDDLGRERTWDSRGWREGSADLCNASSDASSERHGRGEDGRGLGLMDGPHEGRTRQWEWSREVARDRGAAAEWWDCDVCGHDELVHDGRSTCADCRSGYCTPADSQSDTRRIGDRSGLPARRQDAEWGQYGAAIGRWAATLGRPAPDPTADGRLAPVFVEWMMGLPAGWVTEVPDLSRTEQLKALGNGVVPQQAAAALTHLLEVEAVAA